MFEAVVIAFLLVVIGAGLGSILKSAEEDWHKEG